MQTKRLIRFIIAVAFLFVYAAKVNAQQTDKVTDKVLKDTVIKNTKQPIYIGSRGGVYILARAKRTGRIYKVYLKRK